MIYKVDMTNFVSESWDNDWYVCPNCKFDSLDIGFNYCPDCGEEVEFGIEVEEGGGE